MASVADPDKLRAFYKKHIPGAKLDDHLLKAPCPLCSPGKDRKAGTIIVYLDPSSFFLGYFRCLNRCRPGGFPIYFGKIMGIDPSEVPGHDPDRDPYVRDMVYPTKNLNAEIRKFQTLIGDSQFARFGEWGISRSVLEQMKIGYNGRYLVYPYFLENGHCYAARCVMPEREEDQFWHGDEAFFGQEFRIFNVQEIERCEDGALFVTEGEDNLMTLKELGYPGIAVPNYSDLEILGHERLRFINHVFIVMNHSPEAQVAMRSLASRIGFRARILKWPPHLKRGYTLCHLAGEKGKGFRTAVSAMVKTSTSFSPFASPERESQRFFQMLENERGRALLGISSGFKKMDQSLNGIRGINIMGGQPKAGKSCFFMQISTEMARNGTPVIYYDFENGRDKIYTRTLCRLSRISENTFIKDDLDDAASENLVQARRIFKEMLFYFRVVTDRQLSPDIMRRQIDYIQHETRRDHTLIVVDSLHKLPFKNLSERRTGIDEWLRHMENIRDTQNVSFLVISELSRGEGGHYDEAPDLGSFKESGDIEYTADNAMILLPRWDPMAPSGASEDRASVLWLVASRENKPGKIAEYGLDFPFWGFREK